ncbi:MAG: Crp/Fnr family transcriptional regulator [Pseudomonadales bacterium]
MPHLTVGHLARKEVLFHRGDPAVGFYYVLTGQIELGFVAPNGEKKTLEVFGAGRTFAEAVTFMRRQLYPVTAQAVTDAQVVRIPNQAYVDLLYRDPDACMRLLADVCQHLHARVIEIERATVQNARTRLTAFILDEIEEVEQDAATIELALPKHVIASKLSIKPETLSRLLRVMASENLIVLNGARVNVPSVNGLKKSLHSSPA